MSESNPDGSPAVPAGPAGPAGPTPHTNGPPTPNTRPNVQNTPSTQRPSVRPTPQFGHRNELLNPKDILDYCLMGVVKVLTKLSTTSILVWHCESILDILVNIV